MRKIIPLLLAFLPTLAVAQLDPFEGIDRMLRAGRAREAFQTLSFLRQGGPEGSLSNPRFLLLEARILLANGLAEEARASLEALQELPNWEVQVDESE
ncbi:MAG: hypothetical protein HUU16_21535, partial [Candidatus Omnitrophica bacterium]|nr:hypothetical protein [Candidatus Omnitrophota bacterium]